MASESPLQSPWEEEALYIVGDDAIIGRAELQRLRHNVANALARAYEYGFAQGRLAEIDIARAATDDTTPGVEAGRIGGRDG